MLVEILYNEFTIGFLVSFINYTKLTSQRHLAERADTKMHQNRLNVSAF